MMKQLFSLGYELALSVCVSGCHFSCARRHKSVVPLRLILLICMALFRKEHHGQMKKDTNTLKNPF
ncbi:hypothetical protein P9D31_12475 [Bacillus haynesii]|uniref:hypothetical protein n=1 Tax=Bacillus haynesii TaxID=1925021 RepID=UPI002DBF89EB|nr:hypothetical protein [Bacillus haynesii]MEC1473147.1 hypothetical protein [Bacillus haynesii]